MIECEALILKHLVLWKDNLRKLPTFLCSCKSICVPCTQPLLTYQWNSVCSNGPWAIMAAFTTVKTAVLLENGGFLHCIPRWYYSTLYSASLNWLITNVCNIFVASVICMVVRYIRNALYKSEWIPMVLGSRSFLTPTQDFHFETRQLQPEK
jgi:hypothetical protein